MTTDDPTTDLQRTLADAIAARSEVALTTHAGETIFARPVSVDATTVQFAERGALTRGRGRTTWAPTTTTTLLLSKVRRVARIGSWSASP